MKRNKKTTLDRLYSYDKKNKLMSKKILSEITKTFLNIKLHFGYPCDIEFVGEIVRDICYNNSIAYFTK